MAAARCRAGSKLVVQMVETFREHMQPAFVETARCLGARGRRGMALPPVMIYGDDVTHILTEEGIANLLLCRNDEEREQAIRGVAGYTPVGLARDRARWSRTCATAASSAAPRTWASTSAMATRDLLAARSIKDLVRCVGRLVRPAQALPQLVTRARMEHLQFDFERQASAAQRGAVTRWSAWSASGNLEVLIEPAALDGACTVEIITAAHGFGEIWQAVLDDFYARHPLADVRISINDVGATPAVVSLRLDQAVRGIRSNEPYGDREHSYYEANARERLAGMLDAGLVPRVPAADARASSARICAQLDVPGAFDDGVVVGERHARRPPRARRRAGRRVHGRRGRRGARRQARRPAASARVATRPDGVLLLLESGGVRLHEANAGLIAVSEVMRAVLAARVAGVPVVAVDRRGQRLLRRHGHRRALLRPVVMSEEGRLGLSGPEVIETAQRRRGIRFARPRAGVAHHRRQASLSARRCDALVDDDIAAFRAALIALMRERRSRSRSRRWSASTQCSRGGSTLRRLRRRARHLARARLGRADAQVPMLDTGEFHRARRDASRG